MENLKILVNGNKEIAKKAELYLSELGCHISISDRSNCYGWSILKNEGTYYSDESCFNDDAGKLITIDQLRDMVVLKRNSVEDANYKTATDFYYLSSGGIYYFWNGICWRESTLTAIDNLTIIEKPMKETLNDKITSAEVARQEQKLTAWDTQVGGDHYKSLAIQPMQYALANGLDYAQANVVKYVTRHASKNGKQDLLKAIHNIELMIEHYYGE